MSIWDQYRRQQTHAEQTMSERTAQFIKQQEACGIFVTIMQDEVIYTPSPARLAYDKIYTSFNPSGFAMFHKGFEAAAQVARDAKLPEHFQWGDDAMEQFNFGKERAACAILGSE